MIVWAKRGKAVEVYVRLGNEGRGWFVLERNAGASLVTKDTRAPDWSDGLRHQFSVSELDQTGWAALALRIKVVAGHVSGAEMPLFLVVTQEGHTLPIKDDFGRVLNEKGGDYEPIELAPNVKNNVPALREFGVFFK